MMRIIKIKIIVLLLVSIITASSPSASASSTTNNIVTTTATAADTLPQSVQEEVLPLSDQSFGSTINLSNEDSYDQQIAVVGNKSYVVWTDEITGNGDIYFKKSTDGGANDDDDDDSLLSGRINLSNNTGSSVDPQIAAVTNVTGSSRSSNNINNVYVVWADLSSGNGDIYFKKSTDGGASFSSAPINLSNNTGRSFAPQISVSGNNNVYVVWTDETTTTGKADILFKRSTDSGTTFSNTPINLSNNTGSSLDPQIAAVTTTVSGGSSGSSNNVYVVWRDHIAPENFDILFTRSTDGGASFSSPPINLSNTPGSSSYSPQIAASTVSGGSGSNINNVYVVWADLSSGNGDIYFIRSKDGGATFSNTPINLSNENNGASSEPKIATSTVSGGSGSNINNVYVVWTDFSSGNGDIYFIRSTDGGATFSSATKNLSNNTGRSFAPQISVSGNNNVYVVWTDETTTTAKADIYFERSTDGGANFSGVIKNLSDNLGKSSRPPPQPQIAVSGSNVYVVWHYVVWHDSSITSTPSTPVKDDIFLTKSTDGGASFSDPPINLSNDNSGASEIAVSGSNVYVVWAEIDEDTDNDEILFKRSTDGGASFSSAPINLSNNTGSSYAPQIIASGNNVYVVWIDSTTGNSDILFKRSTDGGASFSNTPINLSNNTEFSSYSQMAVSGNNVYVVWIDFSSGNSDILFKRSTDGGASFSNTPINLSNDGVYSYDPQITTSGSNVYVVWVTGTGTIGNEEILFKRSIDGGASFSNTPIDLSNNNGLSSDPQITASGNNVYVVWDDTSTGFIDIYFKRSIDGGASFSGSPINLSNNDGLSDEPQIMASGNNVYVVWYDYTTGNADILFKRSIDGGASFSSPLINLSDNTGDSSTPQITASGNNVYVVWKDFTTENEEILFKRSIDGGASFSSPLINLSDNIGGSYSPQIAVSGSNVYVVWIDWSTEQGDIFFKAGLLLPLSSPNNVVLD